MLEPGDKAPPLTLPDQKNGDPVKLSDLKGQTLVLFFYPRADTVINSIGLR
jgi:thioredoxin-dependent peroxiredoxin